MGKREKRAEKPPRGLLEQHQRRFMEQVGLDQGAVEINEQRWSYANGGGSAVRLSSCRLVRVPIGALARVGRGIASKPLV